MRAATLLLTFMAPLATALMGETQVGRLVVVSAPKDAHLPSSSSLTPEGVVSTMASLANHALHPSSLLSAFSRNGLNALLQPRTNLLVVVDGAPLAFSSDLTGQETFPITSSGAQESSRELVDRMLTGRALTSTKSFGTLADSLCQYYKGGMVVAASPSEQMLAVVSPHRESLAPTSNFYGASFSPKTGKAILAPNSKATGTFDAIFAAKDLQAYNVVLNSGETLFDETVQEDRAFLLEMKALASFLPEIRRSDLSALASDSAADSYTFASTSLQGLSRKYGPSSLQHQHAWLKLTAVLSEVKAQFAELASDNGAFEVLLLEDAVHASPVSRRSIQKRDYTNIASRCYDSEALCLEATGVNSTTTNSTVPCSGHGQCFLVKQATQPERFCYRCKCDHDYTGDKCEFIDIVAPFHIIFWLSLTLLLALALITYGMANMDPGKDTLLFRTVSPKQKRE